MKHRLALAMFCMLAIPVAAAEDNYPQRPIRLVVSHTAGGTSDHIARLVASRMTEVLGQSVIADNRAGAGGLVSAELVARAPPDGYTLLLTGPTALTSNVALRPGQMSFNPEKDFSYITLIGKVPLALVVLPSFPAQSFKEFIAYAKAHPGSINYGSAGVGSTNHLVGELLKVETGIAMTHVPFKGGADALSALLGNQVGLYIATVPTAMPMIKAGRVRAMAVTSSKRSPALPDVPTIAESGLPGFELTSWFCILGPAGMPRPVVTRLNNEIVKFLNTADSRERLRAVGVNVETTTPDEFEVFLKSEIQKMGKVVKSSGARVE